MSKKIWKNKFWKKKQKSFCWFEFERYYMKIKFLKIAVEEKLVKFLRTEALKFHL